MNIGYDGFTTLPLSNGVFEEAKSLHAELTVTCVTCFRLTILIRYIAIGIKIFMMNSITITNTQSSATPSPFQVRVTLDLSSIITSSSQLLQLAFYLSSNGTNQIYAWIESYNSDFSQVVIWLNIPNGIPASSSVTVYYQLTSYNQYPYTGVAPQLTSTYGGYDNGGNVFLFYDNFADTSLDTPKLNALISGYLISRNGSIGFGTNATAKYYWIRARAYPPNGIDPTVYIGASNKAQNEAFYTQTPSQISKAQNEAFHTQTPFQISKAQNEAFHIQSYTVKPLTAQNEAFYIQPYTPILKTAQNEAFFVKQVKLPIPVQNEAFFIQPVKTTIVHITVPEYLHFMSIPQAYYNDLTFSINITTSLQKSVQYNFDIELSVKINSTIKKTTPPAPSNIELQAIETGIFIPALYFLGKFIYKRLIRRRKK